ncbi:TPA: glutamate 5-kinase [Candidatus Woesearchaeota archaeon]|nr:glutamate 5-kinase [Candidatus Woesearchaeota archaeon]
MQERINAAKRILIKIGTATVTQGAKLNQSFLKQKAQEIALLIKAGKEILLVSSGAVAAGLEIEGKAIRPRDAFSLQLLSGKGQIRLMKYYKDNFREHGIQVAQILLTHHNFNNADEFENLKRVINAYIKEKTLPIINTNDVLTKEEFAAGTSSLFSDNDDLAALVAESLDVGLLLILTDVDGLCTDNPKVNGNAQVVDVVEKVTPAIEKMASREAGCYGKGGMLSKVRAAKRVAAKGIPTIVANGKHDIADILSQKVKRTVFV